MEKIHLDKKKKIKLTKNFIKTCGAFVKKDGKNL